MQVRKQSGFTLVEVIVVAGIIAILAGILVPLILKEIDESRISRAVADIRSISSALIVFKKDNGPWPTLDSACASVLTLLVGDGNVPSGLAAQGFDDTSDINFSESLSLNSNGCYTRWKGPYIAMISADPWGYAYVTNAKEFNTSGAPVWILSAGPNGIVETNIAATAVVGDDVALRMK